MASCGMKLVAVRSTADVMSVQQICLCDLFPEMRLLWKGGSCGRAMIMPSPPSLSRPWVWMVVVVIWLPGALEKCIFDEVQQSVTVVTTPTDPDGPHPKTTASNNVGLQTRLTASEDTANPFQIPSFALQLSSSQRPRRKRTRELAPPTNHPQPIRIHTWVPRDSPTLSQVESERLEPAVREAVGIVSNLLSVNRVPGHLLLSRNINKYCKFIWRNASAANYNKCGRANENYRTETCLDVIIPDDHLRGCSVYSEPDAPTMTVIRPEGAGLPDTDFLLYLHAQSTDKCRAEPSVLAYAVHCQTDSLGRPLAGVVVICRDRMTGEGYSHQGTVQTVIHELFHALGFSKELFSTWRDCSYSQPGMGCSPRGQVTNTDETGQVRIYTQSVIRALQEHLLSTDPDLGGPLENLDVGSSGLSSHWESRVLQGSIMAAALGDPAVVCVDPVTLAALQDTGWYSVNHSRAQGLVWGKGEGAMFGLRSTCHDNSSSFFCTGSGLGCHYLHRHKGECQTDAHLDGCRIYKPLMSECWKEENERETETEWSGELYRIDSRCFFSNLSRENVSLSVSDSVVGRCYRHRCTGLNRYQIQVSGSDWLDCPVGSTIVVTGYWGLVACPDKRLCYYPDIGLSIDNQDPHSPAASTTENDPLLHQNTIPDPSLTFDPAPTSAEPGVSTDTTLAAVLGVSAAVCLLAALMVANRRYRSSRVRVHAAPEAPSVLQLHSTQSDSNNC
ncbi:leishmanolysin-like peptidase 2 [Oncorhynchus kisutch]|uniref:leishmanolysin-like peptidase 2 n=1 Tax=Oncorhynchus kisutch TaxID=8019 RepID=UPI0012DC8810|nr:leishmanolysin-like peptidase 2 [Oncorhynchus kisutch]